MSNTTGTAKTADVHVTKAYAARVSAAFLDRDDAIAAQIDVLNAGIAAGYSQNAIAKATRTFADGRSIRPVSQSTLSRVSTVNTCLTRISLPLSVAAKRSGLLANLLAAVVEHKAKGVLQALDALTINPDDSDASKLKALASLAQTMAATARIKAQERRADPASDASDASDSADAESGSQADMRNTSIQAMAKRVAAITNLLNGLSSDLENGARMPRDASNLLADAVRRLIEAGSPAAPATPVTADVVVSA